MDAINDFFTVAGTFLWGWPMIILLLGTHIFLTFRLCIPQRKILKGIRMSVCKDKGATGDVSQFGALATAMAATIGTGNIVGVATAVALGGPGAVLWCWLTGIFGMATKYAEGLLAVKYRVKAADGHYYGGPMYALERGLGMKWLAILFATFTALASFGIGCTVQANSIALLTNETFGIPTWVVGISVCALTASVILGGVKTISKVCTFLVPFMAILYVAGCIVILCMNSPFVWPAIRLIVLSAFNPEAAGSGFVGASVMMAARYGIARGLFSNESGMGSAPIVAATAQTRNPVRQALVSSTGTFWDTVIICAMTGIVLVSSILAYPEISYNDGAALTKVAFSKIPYIGAPVLTFGIITFAFSTILGWSYYGESAVNYIERKKANRFYRILYIVMLFFGSIINLDIIWNIADCMNALMTIPNLVALLLLSGVAAKETKRYLWEDKLDDEMEETYCPPNNEK
ncbi:alanine:cation symporter family protein [Prevotella sp. E13-17]|uniref:alanine/glycine:cation symporter family protein n=1 Tax=Prevotella sp. E13-17 TaxID=2913616 RepID=UPI001EDB2CAC|nr:alanine/glycine:cation symporter family protein [Prevotella sp. E13-17]UKK51550.1 alanine:cation symporter family protein [Prevotella sp. E13-17]